MVSIKTVLTLGAIGVGVALFFGAGGFKGVGTKIGGFFGSGFSDFSKSISSSFTGGLFGGATNANTGGVNDTGIIGPPPRTGTEEFDPFGNLLGNFKGLQNILDSLNNFFTGQKFTEIGGKTFGVAIAPPIVQLGPRSRGTEFGGFINADTQTRALEAAVAESRRRFPEFF